MPLFDEPPDPDGPILYINQIKTLSCAMRKGVVHELTQLVRVSNLQSTDHNVLLQAFESELLPRYGDKLKGKGFEAFDCTDHHIHLLDDPGWADITITYKHPLDEEAAQDLSDDLLGSIYDTETEEGMYQIYGKMRCSLQQKPTSFFPIRFTDGEIANDEPIVVFHDFSKEPADTWPTKDRIHKEGGTINVQQPTKVYSFGGVIDTDKPWLIANLLISSINKHEWLFEDPYTWMCTEVSWEIMTLQKYKFTFQMTHNEDTWLYRPVWVWPDTNKPHISPVENEDYWDIHYHREVDFSGAFGGFFENFTPDFS